MPEDDVVRVGMEGDPSSYLAALNKMQSETKRVLGELEAKYSDSMARVAISTKTLNSVIEQVNKQYGAGAAQLPFFTGETKKYEDEVIRLTEATQALRLEILATNKAIEQQGREIAAAQSLVRSYNANRLVVPQPAVSTTGIPPAAESTALTPEVVGRSPVTRPVSPSAVPASEDPRTRNLTPEERADPLVVHPTPMMGGHKERPPRPSEEDVIENLINKIDYSYTGVQQIELSKGKSGEYSVGGIEKPAALPPATPPAPTIPAEPPPTQAIAATPPVAPTVIPSLNDESPEARKARVYREVQEARQQYENLSADDTSTREERYAARSQAGMKSREFRDEYGHWPTEPPATPPTPAATVPLTPAQTQPSKPVPVTPTTPTGTPILPAATPEIPKPNVPRYEEALLLAQGRERIGQSALQKEMGIGYGHADRLIQALESQGVVGPGLSGGRGREVLARPELPVEQEFTQPTRAAAPPPIQTIPAGLPASAAPPAAPPPPPPAAPPAAPPPDDDEERKRRIAASQAKQPLSAPPPEPRQVPVGAPITSGVVNTQEASVMEMTEKRLTAIASAESLVQRQALTLGEIERDVSASVGMSAQEMGGLYVRATTEMRVASSALITAQKELGPAAAAGSEQAQAAIDSLEGSFNRAKVVADSLKSQISQLSGAEKAAAESAAGLTVATQQHAAAVELLARQEQTLSSIRSASVSGTLTAAEAESLYQRALTESRLALSSLANAQKTIGPAAAQGDAEAIAALSTFETAYEQAKATVTSTKERLAQLNGTQTQTAATTDQAALAANRLAKAEELAARQASTLIALQREVAESSGASASQMGAVHIRATNEMRLASNALGQAQRDLGPAAAEGDAVAQAALDSLSQSYTNASAVVAELKSQIAQLSETEAAATEAASAQATITNQLAAAEAAAVRQSTVLNAIQKEVGANSKVTSEQLGSVYVRAASEARLASTNLAQAQRLIGPAAAQGSSEAVLAIKILEQSYQEASAFADLLKLQINKLSEEEAASAGSAVKNAEAHMLEAQAMRSGAAAAIAAAGGYDELGYSSYRAMASSRALASEAGLGGVGYALSRVASMSKALGPILEAALPVALVVGMGEALYEMSTKAYGAYQNFILMKNEMDEIDKASEAMGKAVEGAFAKGEEAAITHLKRMGLEIDAAKRKVSLEESKPIDLTFGLKTDKDFETKLKDLSTSQREMAKGVFKEILPADLPNELQEVNVRLAEVNYGIEAVRKKREAINQSIQGDPFKGTLNPFVAGELKQTERQENQFNVQRSMYDRLRQVITTNIEARKDLVVQEEDQVREATDRKLIQSTTEQIAIMKENGTYTKAAEAAKWKEVLTEVQKGTAEYREVEQKIGSKSPTQHNRESELRKQDQDALTEMRLHASEVGEVQSTTLVKEEEFVRRRISLEKNYVDNVRFLRAELVRILHEEEAERIKSEGDATKGMRTSEGKPDFAAQAEYWNQIATDSKHAKNAVEEYTNAVEHAQHAGGEAIRQMSEELKRDIGTQYDTWITASHRTEAEILKFWEDVKAKYASDGPVLEETLHKIAEATDRVRQATIKLREVMAQRQEIQSVGGAEMRKAEVEREYKINPPTPNFNPFGDNAADKERKALAAIELEEIRDKQDAQQAKMDAVKQTDGEESAEYQKLVNEKIQLDEEYKLKSYEIETANLESIRQRYQQYFDTINSGMKRIVDNAIDGHKTLAQDFRQMILDLEKQFANFILKSTLMWGEAKFLNWLTGGTQGKQDQHGFPTEAKDEHEKTPLEKIPVVGGVLGKVFGGDKQVTQDQLVVALNRNVEATNRLTASLGNPVSGGGTATGPNVVLGPNDFFKKRDEGTQGLEDVAGPVPGTQLPGAPAYQPMMAEAHRAEATTSTASIPQVLSTAFSSTLSDMVPMISRMHAGNVQQRTSPLGTPEYVVSGTLEKILGQDFGAITDKEKSIFLSGNDTQEVRTHERIHQAQNTLKQPSYDQVVKALSPEFKGDKKKTEEYVYETGIHDASPTEEGVKQDAVFEAPATLFSQLNRNKVYTSDPKKTDYKVDTGQVEAYQNYTTLMRELNPGKAVRFDQVVPPELLGTNEANIGGAIPQQVGGATTMAKKLRSVVPGTDHNQLPWNDPFWDFGGPTKKPIGEVATQGMGDILGPVPGATLPGAPAFPGAGGGGIMSKVLGGALSVGTSLLGIGHKGGEAPGSGAPGSGGGGMAGALNANTQILSQTNAALRQLTITLQQQNNKGSGQGSAAGLGGTGGPGGEGGKGGEGLFGSLLGTGGGGSSGGGSDSGGGGAGAGGMLGALLGGGGSGGQGGGDNGQSVQQVIAKNVMKAISNVNSAAATAFETTMAGTPFPANLVTAPTAGAAALAQGAPYIAGASMEKGGIVPVAAGKTFPAILHGQEMVLPERVSKHVQESVTSHSAASDQATVLSQISTDTRESKTILNTTLRAASSNVFSDASVKEYRDAVHHLSSIDREIRTHEQQHVQAAGPHVISGPHYTTVKGPDSKNYAVGGWVNLDASPVKGDHAATVEKMNMIERSAMAPAQPSPQDYKVASHAMAVRADAARSIRSPEAPSTTVTMGNISLPSISNTIAPEVMRGGEIVQPEQLAAGIQNMIDSHNQTDSRVSSSHQNFHLNYAPTPGSTKTPSNDARGMMREVKRASRTFNKG